MLETLRAWLNADREYFTGVVLYSNVGGNPALLELFKKGKTPYTEKRLQEELLAICNQLKSKENDTAVSAETNPVSAATADVESESSIQPGASSIEELQPNPALYAAAKQQADKAYKEVMNLRAELFALARADDFTDPNSPDRIQAREKLAIGVVLGFQKVSQLYDQADYVKQHGRLPHQSDDGEENDYDALPDHLVKQTLDNLRKNVNKMKKREATPERLALIQKHEVSIEKLIKRWRSLQPVK